MRKIFYSILIFLLFQSCSFEQQTYETIKTSDKIRSQVLYFANLYVQADTEYVLGGQDALRAIKVDCSGFVIMCYKYALVDTNHSLLFNDATAQAMHDNFTFVTTQPK